MIRRPPRSTLSSSSAASDVYKRQTQASTSVVKDTVDPTVAIISTPVINNSNKASYTVSGSCSETGESVSIQIGSVATTDTCSLLTWSATVDISGDADTGFLIITAI